MRENSKQQYRSAFGGIASGVVFALLIIGVIVILRDDQSPPIQDEELDRSRRQALSSRPEPISSALREFSDRENKSHHELAELLRSLPADLSAAEVALLLEWLPIAHVNQAEVALGQTAHLVNEVINLLRSQKSLPEGLPEILMAMATSVEQPDLIRDYAIQHLRPLWSALPNEDSSKGQIETLLWEAVKSGHATRSGTALIALHQLGHRESLVSKGERAIENEKFVPILRASLSDPQVPISMKMASMRILEDRHLDGELDLVRSLLESSSLNLAMRLKAIAVIGSLGAGSDRALLSSLEGEPRLRPALKRALQILPQ